MLLPQGEISFVNQGAATCPSTFEPTDERRELSLVWRELISGVVSIDGPLAGNLDAPATLARLAGLADRVVHLAPPAGQEGGLKRLTPPATAAARGDAPSPAVSNGGRWTAFESPTAGRWMWSSPSLRGR